MHSLIIDIFWLIACQIFAKDVETVKKQLNNIKDRFDNGENDILSNHQGAIKQLITVYLRHFKAINL